VVAQPANILKLETGNWLAIADNPTLAPVALRRHLSVTLLLQLYKFLLI
jgi:hypothetical protein